RRRPGRHLYDADPGRPRAGRADEVSATRSWSRPSQRLPRRTRWACGRSCSRSKTSTTPWPACAPTAPNSSARWSSTRTGTDSATCEALRASSSRWPRNSPDAFTAFLACLRRGLVRRALVLDHLAIGRLHREAGAVGEDLLDLEKVVQPVVAELSTHAALLVSSPDAFNGLRVVVPDPDRPGADSTGHAHRARVVSGPHAGR